MEKIEVEDVRNEPNPLGVHGIRRPLSDALGTEDVSMAFYELASGEQFSGGLHTHHDQEEVFYVLEGTATFDIGTERETVDVEAGQLIRFPPGEFQSGRNETDESVRALAIGAPGAQHNWTDLESMVPCPECGEVTSHGVREPTEGGRMPVYCNECGNELF